MSTCPQPDNSTLTPLYGSKFQFGIQKLPNLSFSVQSFQLPSVTIDVALQDTPLQTIPHRGAKVNYEDLSITFIVDSKMDNYKVLYNWIMNWCDRCECCAPNNLYDVGEMTDFSDGYINIFDPKDKSKRISTIKFIDMIPYSIGAIEFSTTNQEDTIVTATATFKFTYFMFDDEVKSYH